MDANDPRHGTYAGAVAHHFSGNPPCDACLDAQAAYQRRRRARLYLRRTDALLIPARGTLRRIQALAALGWPLEVISYESGRGRTWASALLRHEHVYESTAQLIDQVYRRLSMTVPPEDQFVARRRTIAKARGWVPPLAWDDIDNDEHPADMGKVRDSYARADLIAEYEHLVNLGVSREQALDRIGVTKEALRRAYAREVAA